MLDPMLYCYENGNSVLKMINKSTKNNEHVYIINEKISNNISIKGIKNKQATIKHSKKKAEIM